MTQFESAVRALRDSLLSGAYPPGSPLTAAQLAAELGMSRTPVREALRTLASEGLVDLEHNRIARVTAWTDENLGMLFEIRARLEGLACRSAAAKISPAQLDDLEHIALRIAVAAEPGPEQDVELVQRLNSEFHSQIVAIADAPALTMSMSAVVYGALLTRTRAAYTDDEQRRSSQHHIELVAALRQGDSEWAESVMRSHLLQGKAALLRGEGMKNG